MTVSNQLLALSIVDLGDKKKGSQRLNMVYAFEGSAAGLFECLKHFECL